MNKSVLSVLMRGSPEEREGLLSSLRGMEGVKHASFIKKDVVRLDVSRGIDFAITIRPGTLGAVKRLVTAYLHDWNERASHTEASQLIKRVFDCLGSARSFPLLSQYSRRALRGETGRKPPFSPMRTAG